MSAPVPLRYGLCAVYTTRAELARQQRAQARNEGRQPDDNQQNNVATTGKDWQ